jgi:hypothetical protein
MTQENHQTPKVVAKTPSKASSKPSNKVFVENTEESLNFSDVQKGPTFQDNIFEMWKIFWKAGYSYAKTGNSKEFYTTLLEDVMNMSQEEFLNKYGN